MFGSIELAGVDMAGVKEASLESRHQLAVTAIDKVFNAWRAIGLTIGSFLRASGVGWAMH